MKITIKIINYILIRLFNRAIFSEFSIEYKDEKSKLFKKHIINYCGYHKNYDLNDWRFSENESRKNVKYQKLKLTKFI